MKTSLPQRLILFPAMAAWAGLAAAGEIRWELSEREPPAVAQVNPRYLEEHVTDVSLQVEIDVTPETVTESIRRQVYFGTVEGVQEDGVVSIVWDSGNETLVMREALVIGADGSRHRFDPATARVLDRDTYDVFTDSRELVVQLPGLAPGGSAILRYERVTDRSALVVPWQAVSFLQTLRPRQRLEYTVRWTGEAPVWRNTYDGMHCTESIGRLDCVAEHVPGVPVDPEVNYLDVLPGFVVGERKTWDGVIEQVNRGVDQALAGNAGVAEFYQGLVASLPDLDARIARLHEFVSRDIRYVSMSSGEHTIVPHAISQTLQKRYGDCKDKTVLLVALLRLAGVDAFPVLVATAREEPERLELPGTAYFDHMVACMRRQDGSETCFDATDAYSDAAFVPHGIQGRVRLVLRPGSTPDLVPAEEYRWRLAAVSSLDFLEDGGQSERQERTYTHAYGAWLRSFLAAKTPDQRRQWALESYKSVVSNQADPEFEFHGMEKPGETLVIESTNNYEAVVDPAADLNYTEYAHWLRDVALGFRTGNTHYPYRFAGLRVTSADTFNISERWKLERHGADLDLQSRFGVLKRTHAVKGAGEVTVHTELTMPRSLIPVAELDDFNRFLDIVARESMMRVVATPKF